MSFENFTLNGVNYPLDHLDDFDVLVAAKDPLMSPATLRVTFSHHVFSKAWKNGVDDVDHEYEKDGARRAFCATRYGCSIELRNLIEYHIAGKAFYSRDGNGVQNTLFYAVADGITYLIIFNLRRSDWLEGIDGILHVLSAYQKPDMPARHKLLSVKFARLVHQKCPPKAKK